MLASCAVVTTSAMTFLVSPTTASIVDSEDDAAVTSISYWPGQSDNRLGLGLAPKSQGEVSGYAAIASCPVVMRSIMTGPVSPTTASIVASGRPWITALSSCICLLADLKSPLL